MVPDSGYTCVPSRPGRVGRASFASSRPWECHRDGSHEGGSLGALLKSGCFVFGTCCLSNFLNRCLLSAQDVPGRI